MVEDVRLQSLVVSPVRVIGEAVDLQGQALGPRLDGWTDFGNSIRCYGMPKEAFFALLSKT